MRPRETPHIWSLNAPGSPDHKSRPKEQAHQRRIITIADPTSSKPVIDESEIQAKLGLSKNNSVPEDAKSTSSEEDKDKLSETNESIGKEQAPPPVESKPEVVKKASKPRPEHKSKTGAPVKEAKISPVLDVSQSSQIEINKTESPKVEQPIQEKRESLSNNTSVDSKDSSSETPSDSAAREPTAEEIEEWQEVKIKRGKKVKGVVVSTVVSKRNNRVPELDFKFDDEIDAEPHTGSHRERRTSSHSLKDEMTDANIDQLIILTPNPAKRQYDRTGDFTKRSDRNQRLNEEMEHGLRRYEEELWSAEARHEPPNPV